MSDNGSVRVAVRIRPFNSREREMNAKVCLRMDGPTTYITEPETGVEKPFTFDYSYWSHDGFHEDENGVLVGDTDKYATQRRVFDDLGRDVLNSAFEGYNSCLFAYGQTGSGKSYSMMGYGPNKGIVPIVCEEMFKIIDANTDPEVKYEVVVSMLEIYNECVRDLLNPKNNPPGGLKIRYQAEIGVYVEDLLEVPVSSFAEIDAKMNEGTLNRSVASTKMNATSSRAHTVFSVVLVKRRSMGELKSEIRSRINLVDLAGSERADSTGATGDRLKEGCAINQSLSALGNVISALADKANGKKKVFIPYRNSALTRLLQDALGGNSRTIMICALSPADVNYDETISTLRYAQRAKQIKNKVVKNENPTDKLIQQLKEENERLTALLAGKLPLHSETTDSDVQALKSQLEQIQKEKEDNEKMLKQLQQSWEEKLKEAQQQQQQQLQNGVGNLNDPNALHNTIMQSSATLQSAKYPYLLNIHEDPMLNECVAYGIRKDVITIGKQEDDTEEVPDIVVSGLNVKTKHAVIKKRDTEVWLYPCVANTKLFVNGDLVGLEGVKLQHHDRIIVGNNFIFRYNDPMDANTDKEKDKTSKWCGENAYNNIVQEYQIKQGLRVQNSDINKIEAEENARTKELEAKLRMLEQEKEAKLAQEAQIMSRTDLTPQQKQEQLRVLQSKHQSEMQSFNVNLKAMQAQIRKQRQLKRLQGVMSKLTPLLVEANSVCEELGKPLVFESKLVINPEPNQFGFEENSVRNMNMIYPQIIVRDKSNQTYWSWDMAKFESRLFLMRELYTKVTEHGPLMLKLTQDPFWDPPQPICIGKGRIVLKALAQLVDCDGSMYITNEQGRVQGKLQYEIIPVDSTNEPLEYKSHTGDTVGEIVHLKFNFLMINDIPIDLSNHVTLEFQCYQHRERITSPIMYRNVPNIPYNVEKTLFIGKMTQEMVHALETGALIIRVYGYSNAQMEYMNTVSQFIQLHTDGKTTIIDNNAPLVILATPSQKEKNKQPTLYIEEPSMNTNATNTNANTSGGSSSDSGANATKMQMMDTPDFSNTDSEHMHDNTIAKDAVCDQCSDAIATRNCEQCAKLYCSRCCLLMHKAASRKSHSIESLDDTPVVMDINSPKKSPIERITTKTANLSLSTSNNSRTSGSTSSSSSSSSGGSGSDKTCGKCQGASAQWNCPECQIDYCEHCNMVMHKAASRKNHVRTPLSGNTSSGGGGGGSGSSSTTSMNTNSTSKIAVPIPSMSTTSTSTSTSTQACGKCQETGSKSCAECQTVYCDRCDMLMHKAPSRKNHVRTELNSSSTTTTTTAVPPVAAKPTATAQACGKCQEPSSKNCPECQTVYCDRCDMLMHKAPSRKNHVRTAL